MKDFKAVNNFIYSLLIFCVGDQKRKKEDNSIEHETN